MGFVSGLVHVEGESRVACLFRVLICNEAPTVCSSAEKYGKQLQANL